MRWTIHPSSCHLTTKPNKHDTIESSQRAESRIEMSSKSSRPKAESLLGHQIIGSIARVVGDTSPSPALTLAKSWMSGAATRLTSGHLDRSARSHFVTRCSKCEGLFVKPKCEVDKAHRKGHVDLYCTQKCAQDHHATKNARLCVVCATPVPKSKRSGRQTGRIYCHPCYRALRLARASFQKRPCPQCATWFWPVTSRQRFCSRGCANSAHSDRMVGEGNSHFKDGTSYAKWFDEMRAIVLERDGNACAVCDTPNRMVDLGTRKRSNLHIHHIDSDPKNNLAENLVAMCYTCHAVHHKSKKTPWPWLSEYATAKSMSMTSKLKEIAISLRTKFSSTTA